MVQHSIGGIAEPDHLRLVSSSDVLTPANRVTAGVIWDLSVKKTGGNTCELTNVVHSFFTPELLDSLAKKAFHGRSSKRLASLFQRRTTGRRRPSSPKVWSAMPGTQILPLRRTLKGEKCLRK